jgi:hypothetical protein
LVSGGVLVRSSNVRVEQLTVPRWPSPEWKPKPKPKPKPPKPPMLPMLPNEGLDWQTKAWQPGEPRWGWVPESQRGEPRLDQIG